MGEIQPLAPGWVKGSQIAIFDHPHPGEPPWRWAYCQQIFNLFIPKAEARIILDATTPETAYSYRFAAGRLEEN